MSEVNVVIGAGSIGQAIARRVSAGKHVLVADLHQGNADAAAEVMSNAGFEVSKATHILARVAADARKDGPRRSATSPVSSTPQGSHPARRRQRRSWPWTCVDPPCCSRSSGT